LIDFGSISIGIFALGRKSLSGVQPIGTTFALDKAGYFATAHHVVGFDEKNLVLIFNLIPSIHDYQDTSDRDVHLLPAKLFASDPFHDLAVLKVDIHLSSNIPISGTDSALVGTQVTSFGFPHADHGRIVLTRQDTEIGARVLINTGGIKARHLVLNTQARPGQSGSPIYRKDNGQLVAVLVGSYAPGGGSGITISGVDPNTLHQTTHAVSAEYLLKMYQP
jgi:S1-C subfamily serine protease